MKRINLILLTFLVSLFFVSCTNSEEKLKRDELYRLTGDFVESLQTTRQSYGFRGQEYTEYTKDNTFKVTPIGRLINVRIETVASREEYETLKNDLKEHYKNDSRVRDVYICTGGTVMIDCRN